MVDNYKIYHAELLQIKLLGKHCTVNKNYNKNRNFRTKQTNMWVNLHLLS